MPDIQGVAAETRAVYRIEAAAPEHLLRARENLAAGFGRWRLAAALAWLDIRNR